MDGRQTGNQLSSVARFWRLAAAAFCLAAPGCFGRSTMSDLDQSQLLRAMAEQEPVAPRGGNRQMSEADIEIIARVTRDMDETRRRQFARELARMKPDEASQFLRTADVFRSTEQGTRVFSGEADPRRESRAERQPAGASTYASASRRFDEPPSIEGASAARRRVRDEQRDQYERRRQAAAKRALSYGPDDDPPYPLVLGTPERWSAQNAVTSRDLPRAAAREDYRLSRDGELGPPAASDPGQIDEIYLGASAHVGDLDNRAAYRRDDAVRQAAATAAIPHSPQPAAVGSNWRDHALKAIEAMEQSRVDGRGFTEDGERSERLEAYLRLLYIIVGRRDDALDPLHGRDQDGDEYWRNVFHSMMIQMEADTVGGSALQASMALRQLRKAEAALIEKSSLDVRNLKFCDDVTSFGLFQEHPNNIFLPGQPLLLYLEVDNFVSVKRKNGYETQLKGSYEIYDDAGERLETGEFPSSSETCHNRRRDYFMRFPIVIPKVARSGRYTLQFMVNDEKGGKFGTGTIDFEVNRPPD